MRVWIATEGDGDTPSDDRWVEGVFASPEDAMGAFPRFKKWAHWPAEGRQHESWNARRGRRDWVEVEAHEVVGQVGKGTVIWPVGVHTLAVPLQMKDCIFIGGFRGYGG